MNTVAWIGTAIAGACACYYIYETLFGDTKPQRVTWTVWAVAAVLGASSAYEGGAGPGAYVASVYVGLTVIIAFLAWIPRFGAPGGEHKYDPYIFWVALAATLAWWVFDLPAEVAAIVAVLTDVAVFWPTLRSAWLTPQNEPPLAWGGDALAATLALVVIFSRTSDFAGWFFTLYLAVAQTLITLILIWRRSVTRESVRS